MATTFRDFIVECELYPHSRENFEFMKECSEIEISEKFIHDQMFLAENKEAFTGSDIVFEESYFQESVDDTSLEVLTEKFNGKVKNLVTKMISKILKIFKAFSNFFGKIGNKFDPTTVKGQSVKARLAKVTLDDEKLAKIKEIVNGAKSNDASAFPIRVNQPYKKNIKLNYGGADNEIEALRDALAVALSDNKVVAEALFNDSGDDFDARRIGIMDPDDLYDAGMTLCVGKQNSILNVAKTLTNSWTQVKKNGLVIEVNTKSINKTAERLQELCDKITEIGNDIARNAAQAYVPAKVAVSTAANAATNAFINADNADNANSDSQESDVQRSTKTKVLEGIAEVLVGLDSATPNASEITKAINDAVAMLTGAIGLTTKVYTQLNNYRTTVIKQLDSYLESVK
jgi:hypothetical protein